MPRPCPTSWKSFCVTRTEYRSRFTRVCLFVSAKLHFSSKSSSALSKKGPFLDSPRKALRATLLPPCRGHRAGAARPRSHPPTPGDSEDGLCGRDARASFQTMLAEMVSCIHNCNHITSYAPCRTCGSRAASRNFTAGGVSSRFVDPRIIIMKRYINTDFDIAQHGQKRPKLFRNGSMAFVGGLG